MSSGRGNGSKRSATPQSPESEVLINLSNDALTVIIRQSLPDLEGPVSSEPIPTGKFNSSFFVTADNRRFVLRIAPPRDAVFLFYENQMMRQEPKIHRLLLDRSSVPVAEILAFDNTRRLLDRDFMLMRRLPGAPLTDTPCVNTDDVFRQVGGYLAEAHAITADGYGYLGDHHPMEPQGRWVDAFEIMWNRLLDDIVMVGHYDSGEADPLRRLLDRHLPLFDRPVQASLLHMDIWHQNILVDGKGQVTGIVDWDRSLRGDPEIEFAVLDYCGVSEPAFWEGYGKERDLSPEAHVRQIFYLLYELQKYIVIRQGRNRDPEGARRYKAQAISILRQSFGDTEL